MGSICRGLAAVSAILPLFGSVQARADEQLHVGPQPLWIEPVAEPPASRDGGAVVLRLIDQQARIDAEGTHQFTRQIIRVNAAEGLQAAGTVGGTWQPATDRLTLHKALIHRDGKQIDILKYGKSFTILRRESGLEAAARYIDVGRLQLSDYGDWQTFSALIGPLYEKAITLAPDSPLHAEIAKIAAASNNPKVRALVQTQVRYFADLNGLGGYSPASADAALHAAYIEAEKRHPASPEVSGERLRLEQERRQAAP